MVDRAALMCVLGGAICGFSVCLLVTSSRTAAPYVTHALERMPEPVDCAWHRYGPTWETLYDLRMRLADGGRATRCDRALIDEAARDIAWLNEEVAPEAVECFDELHALEAELGDAAAFCDAMWREHYNGCIELLGRYGCECKD